MTNEVEIYNDLTAILQRVKALEAWREEMEEDARSAMARFRKIDPAIAEIVERAGL